MKYALTIFTSCKNPYYQLMNLNKDDRMAFNHRQDMSYYFINQSKFYLLPYLFSEPVEVTQYILSYRFLVIRKFCSCFDVSSFPVHDF